MTTQTTPDPVNKEIVCPSCHVTIATASDNIDFIFRCPLCGKQVWNNRGER